MRSMSTSARSTCTSAACARRSCAAGAPTRSAPCAAQVIVLSRVVANNGGPALLQVHPNILIVALRVGRAAQLRASLDDAGFCAVCASNCREAEHLTAGMAIDAVVIDRSRWD